MKRKILEDELIEIEKEEMIRIKKLMRKVKIMIKIRIIEKWNGEKKVEIIEKKSRLRGNRDNDEKFIKIGKRFLERLIDEIGIGDEILDLGKLIKEVINVEKIIMDRINMIIEIILEMSIINMEIEEDENKIIKM